MKKTHLLLLLVALIFIVSITTFFVYQNIRVLNQESLPIFVSVAEESGVVLSSEALNFGQLVPGQKAKKRIIIRPAVNAKIDIRLEGDLASQIFIDMPSDYQQLGYLPAGKDSFITFEIVAPQNYANYTGTAHVTVIRD